MLYMRPMKDAVERAIKAAGTASALAKALKISEQAVSQWRRGERPVPANRVLDVERITGVSRHELRPDVFGAPEAAA